MINHIRTLLLNRSGSHGYGYACPGEEYVPPTFQRRVVPSFLRGALQALFGATPDRTFLNFRMWQLMTLLHSTELAEHVYAADPRVTYWPVVTNSFMSSWGTTVDFYAGDAPTLYWSGEQLASEGMGRTEWQWDVGLLVGAGIQIVSQVPAGALYSGYYTTADGLSEAVTMPGAGLQLRFATPATPAQFIVTHRARPTTDIGVVLQQAAALIGDVEQLFLPATEYLQLLRRLWMQQTLFPYKYSALLLAIANYLETCPVE
jgi:hypothetical protein